MSADSNMHAVVSRKEWLTARLELLRAEKEHTRQGDQLAQSRQALPWVRVDKDYTFETEDGISSLAELFRGRSQLMVYHFMFGPDYIAGCPSCSAIADGFNGIYVHLANHDVMLWAISRSPLSRLQAYQKRLGWTFPWASSYGSDFNFDYGVGFESKDQEEGLEYNYRREAPRRNPGTPSGNAYGTGVDLPTYLRERPGVSCFVLQAGEIYHTYSTYARGLDGLWGMWQWLDRAPKGRNPSTPNATGHWWRRRDEYDNNCC